jgi:O-antigen/teichoic acid export membrane protein
VYARVFLYFTFGLMLVMFGVSLLAESVLGVLASEEYRAAAGLVPIVLLAYVLFAFHGQFSVPAMLAKRTKTLVPAAAAGVLVNVSANLFLIPRFGTYGAAWASVLTYGTFSFVGLTLYRRIDRYPYDFLRVALVGAGFVATWFLFRSEVSPRLYGWARVAAAAVVWIIWAVLLFQGVVRRWRRSEGPPGGTPA